MTSELEVDAAAVRAWATALSATAARISTVAPLPPGGPPWSSTAAAVAVAEAARGQLSALAEDITAAARQASAAADDYDDADDRAAARLRGVG
ncbi:hypothetical protein [Actinoplanes sp. NPDC049599]|uniref:hypothetical protein n=1 Tax=Actinoplanes sp. NPDC049599 TaxID=3363903 RepID=UPI00379206D9